MEARKMMMVMMIFVTILLRLAMLMVKLKRIMEYAAVKSFLTNLMQSLFISKGHHQRRMVIGKIDNDIGDNDEQAIL